MSNPLDLLLSPYTSLSIATRGNPLARLVVIRGQRINGREFVIGSVPGLGSIAKRLRTRQPLGKLRVYSRPFPRARAIWAKRKEQTP